MAQKVQTLLVDDIDGGEAEGTVRFGLDGTSYEIDLSVAHQAELRGALARFIAAGRKVPAAGWPPGGRRRCRRDGSACLGEESGDRGQGPRPDPRRDRRAVSRGDREVRAPHAHGYARALPGVRSRRWPRRSARSAAHGLGAARSAQGHLPFVQIAGIGSAL